MYVLARKILGFIVVPTLSLIDVSNKVQHKTEIKYNGKKVNNLSSTIIKIKNMSLSGLDDKQIVTPLKIVFDENINLLEYDLIERSKSDRCLDIDLDKNIANIKKFTLLNKWNYIIVRIIHEGIPSSIKIPLIKGDIKDFEIKRYSGTIKNKKEKYSYLFESLYTQLLGLFIFSTFSILLIDQIIKAQKIQNFDYIIFIFLIVFILLSIFMIYTGIKKLYQYFTSLVILNQKEFE